MGGAKSVMPVIRDAFSQWADSIDWTVRCYWLLAASVVTCSLRVLTFNFQLLSCKFYRWCDTVFKRGSH